MQAPVPEESIARPDLLIVVVGLHSAGKTTIARALAKKLRVPMLELGQVVRREAAHRRSSSLVQLAAQILADDPLYIARETLAHLRDRPAMAIVVGPRTAAELDHLKSSAARTLTVGIDASPEVRARQWRRRHLRFDDTWDEREWQERQWETAKLIPTCDIVLQAGNDITIKCLMVLSRLQEIGRD